MKDVLETIEDAAGYHHDHEMPRRLAVNVAFQDKQREALNLAAQEIRRLREELARRSSETRTCAEKTGISGVPLRS